MAGESDRENSLYVPSWRRLNTTTKKFGRSPSSNAETITKEQQQSSKTIKTEIQDARQLFKTTQTNKQTLRMFTQNTAQSIQTKLPDKNHKSATQALADMVQEIETQTELTIEMIELYEYCERRVDPAQKRTEEARPNEKLRTLRPTNVTQSHHFELSCEMNKANIFATVEKFFEIEIEEITPH